MKHKHGSFLNKPIYLGPYSASFPGNCDVCGWKVYIYAGLSQVQTIGFRSECCKANRVREFCFALLFCVCVCLVKFCVLVRDHF